MNIFKRGRRFTRQETAQKLNTEELSFVVANLTQHGLQLVAALGLSLWQDCGCSLNEMFELLGETPKEGN